MAYQAGKLGRMVNESSRQSEPVSQEKVQTKLPQPYPSTIAQTDNFIPDVKTSKLKSPSNIFKNKSSFGKVKKLKVGCFN